MKTLSTWKIPVGLSLCVHEGKLHEAWIAKLPKKSKIVLFTQTKCMGIYFELLFLSEYFAVSMTKTVFQHFMKLRILDKTIILCFFTKKPPNKYRPRCSSLFDDFVQTMEHICERTGLFGLFCFKKLIYFFYARPE